MSVWKSPILYLGILVFVLVVGALAAPFVLNWNAYKPRLEAYGQNLTGRKVTIDGPIAVRLFPIPRLVAEDVRIINADNDKTIFAAADKIIIDVTLGGLLNGSLDVQSIKVDAPIINIIRRKSGAGNWVMSPSENLRNSALLKNVKLENINLNRATVVFRDEGKGFEQTLQDLNLNVSAPSVLGPWRANGSGFNNGRALNINVTTSEFEDEQPFRVSARIAPLDPSYPQYALDAELKGEALVGGLRVDIVPTEGVKTSRITGWRALQMIAKFDATFDKIKLADISITPRDTKDGSTLIEGAATIDMSKGIVVDTQLKSPRINADQLLGGNSAVAFNGNGVMALANEMFNNLPSSVAANVSLDATVLTLGEDKIENVSLDLFVEKNAARIKRLSGNFPGRTRLLLNGVMFPAEKAAELGGKLAFESNDLRSFITWARPTYSDMLKKYWVGTRGHLRGDADFKWQGDNIGLNNLRYELDGIAGDASVNLKLAEPALVQVKLKTKTLDLDSYLRNSDGKVEIPWFDLSNFLMGEEEASEKSFDITADQLILNGVSAKSAVLDFISGKSGIDIKSIQFADLAGSALNANGQILKAAQSYVGQMKGELAANNLTSLMQFVGLQDNKRVSEIATKLQRADISAQTTFKPVADGTAIDISISGKSGTLIATTQGEVTVSPGNNIARVSGAMKLNAPDSMSVMQLIVPSIDRLGEPAEILLTLDGDLGEKSITKLNGKIYGTNLNFDGKTTFTGGGFSSQGNLGLESDDVTTLMQVLGVNVSERAAAKLSGAAQIGSRTDISLNGTWNVQPLSLTWRSDVNNAHQIDLSTPKLNLKSVLNAALLSNEENLRDTTKDFFNAEIWLRPDVMLLPDGTETKDAAFGVKSVDGKRVMSFLSETQGRKPVKLEAELSNENFVPAIKFKFDGPVALNSLNPISGNLHLNMSGKATGLDVSQILTSAEATGTFQSSSISVSGVDVTKFSELVQAVKTDTDLRGALNALEQNGVVQFEPANGAVFVSNGELKLSQLDHQIPGGATQLALEADLNARTLASALTIRLREPKTLPPIEIIYSGHPGQIQRTIRSSAFASELGFDILARDMQELERVQQEQIRLEQEEALQQAMDAEKFAAFQAQRAELRLRARELRVHADLRTKTERKRQQVLEQLLRDPSLIASNELDRRRRENEVHILTANGASSPAVISDNSSLTPLNFNDVDGVPVQP